MEGSGRRQLIQSIDAVLVAATPSSQMVLAAPPPPSLRDLGKISRADLASRRGRREHFLRRGRRSYYTQDLRLLVKVHAAACGDVDRFAQSKSHFACAWLGSSQGK